MKWKRSKTTVSAVLTLLMAVTQLCPAYAADIQQAETNVGQQYTIGIVSTNDIHAHAAGDESSQLGMAKIKTIITNTEADSDLTLALDAGDFYHGQAFATLEKGESMAELAAAVGYDAISVGNHDWNYGKDQLKNLEAISQTNNSEFALLSGNVVNADGTQFFDNPYITRELSIGEDNESAAVKIGVFGVIDPAIYASTSPSNVEGLTFTDMKAYTEEVVEQMKADGCQIIVGMSHCIDPRALAAQTADVDLWIDGHDHISLNEQITNADGEQVRIIEAGCYGSEADVTKLTFNGTTERNSDGTVSASIQNLNMETTAYFAADTSIQKDADVQALYEQIAGAQQSILDTVIGTTPVDLNASWEQVRIGESTMGRVITDAYLYETEADIAVENAGGIRTNGTVSAGDIKNQDVINTFPYGNYIVTKQLTGAQVKTMLETSIEIGRQNKEANDSGDYNAWPSHSGSYLQVGGIVVHYDLDEEAGSRIWSVTKDGKELDDSALYTIATNNYMAVSAEYPELAQAEEVNQYNACDEAFIQYVSADTQTGGLIAQSTATERMTEGKAPLHFSDIEAGAYYEEAVNWAIAEGITNGTTATTFSPDNSCTRGQMVTFLWRAMGEQEPTSTENAFADVSADASYYEAVLWAAENGITMGTSATAFSPDASCTRAETAVFLWRAEGEQSNSGNHPFVDVSSDAWYSDAVLWAAENEITNGMSETTFEPDTVCTRGQIVTFLYRDMA